MLTMRFAVARQCEPAADPSLAGMPRASLDERYRGRLWAGECDRHCNSRECRAIHEVSILMAARIAVGLCGGIRRPQRLDDAHGRARARARLIGRSRIGRASPAEGRRHEVEQLAASARLSAFTPLAAPQWRMRWKPVGSAWIRKRRMNSWASSVIVL